MSCFYDSRRDMLVLKCDCCGKKVDLYKGETDRLLANDWIHKNGWKTIKIVNCFNQVCPECKAAIEERYREEWMNKNCGVTDNAPT